MVVYDIDFLNLLDLGTIKLRLRLLRENRDVVS